MPRSLRRMICCMAMALASSARADAAPPPTPPSSKPVVEAAIANVLTLNRPGEDGLATVWDGNKYVQCRHMADRSLRCEAGGALMQPSLARVLVPRKTDRLAELGWNLDPSFGNYVRIFSPDMASDKVAEAILTVLGDVYDADLNRVDAETSWIPSEPCPPRHSARQNLAGMIDESPEMAAYTIHACSYTLPPGLTPQPIAHSAQDLIDIYGARVAGEIGRLRVNATRHGYVVLNTDVGYVQCAPETPPPILYCEAASADSWPVLAGVLTPERLARLHAAGFSDPGHSPNYEKTYPLDTSDNADIARQLLTVLYDVYGYDGAKTLRFQTK